MKGIRMKHGAVFVELDGMSYRYMRGKWGVSPILFGTLQWELRTTPPDEYEHLTADDICGMGDGVYEELLKLHEKTTLLLEGRRSK